MRRYENYSSENMKFDTLELPSRACRDFSFPQQKHRERNLLKMIQLMMFLQKEKKSTIVGNPLTHLNEKQTSKQNHHHQPVLCGVIS